MAGDQEEKPLGWGTRLRRHDPPKNRVGGWGSLLSVMVLLAGLGGCKSPSDAVELEGQWRLVEKQVASDGCQLVPPSLRGDPCQLSCDSVSVKSTGDSSWEMRFIERGGTARCEAFSGGFKCTAMDTRGPPDAQVQMVDFMEGYLHEDGSMRGVFALEMVCTGPGCSLQPAFAQVDRCETRGTFRGERSEGTVAE